MTGAGATIAGRVATAGDSVSANTGPESDASDGSETSDEGEDPNTPTETVAPPGWTSYRGNEGNTCFFEAGPEIDGESLEVAWTVECGCDGFAITDDFIYMGTGDGVVARRIDDGSIEWSTTDVSGTFPVVADETLYLDGDGEIVALDPTDGSRCWQSDIGGAYASAPTAAYGAVYATVDGSLYALEAEDGSIRWRRELLEPTGNMWGCEAPRFRTAAANELLYVATVQSCFVLDPKTGETVDQFGSAMEGTVTSIAANSTAIATESTAFGGTDATIYDSETKDIRLTHGGSNFALGDDIAVTSHRKTGLKTVDLESGDTIHQWSIGSTRPVLVGDTVYVYSPAQCSKPGSASGSIVALDTNEGIEKWRFEVGPTDRFARLALSGTTIYLVSEDGVTAIREASSDDVPDDGSGSGDDSDGSDGADGSGDGSDGSGDSGGSGGSGDDSKSAGGSNGSGGSGSPDGSGESGDGSAGAGGSGSDSGGADGSGDESIGTADDTENESAAPASTKSTGGILSDINPLGALTGLAVMGGGAALASRRFNPHTDTTDDDGSAED
ncbi:PQQ-binding-like beta-propeller repeat protein [Natrinema caseinilyticum]|uniref:outer membrane protein assembly factor BamB family protein n=1 Tax=Natrinema caseinilyticum TaxID=2961570 RepID=UPI002413F0C4|nr:PQQ-binding-like beta-propeller repeat protein [Natrinema caseinilyticum]